MTLLQPSEGELKLNGLRIHYFEWKPARRGGGACRRPLVLMHGLRDYAYYWQDCANRLLDDFHIFAPDIRGHGESEFAPGGYGVWSLAADLSAFVDAIGLERFDLLGLSLGSRVAMAYARDNSLRLKHLLLADMGPQMAKVGARGLKDDMTAKADIPPSTFTLDQAREFYRKQWPSLDPSSIERLIQNSLVQREEPVPPSVAPSDVARHLQVRPRGESVPTSVAQGPSPEIRVSRSYSNRYDRRLADVTTKAAIPEINYLWDSLARVRCPALVLRGEHSPILDDEISSRMVRSLPNGQLYVFPDTGHSLPRLRPEEFATVVRAFLTAE